MLEKVYENSDFLIVWKENNLPTVPLKNRDCDNLLKRVVASYPEVLDVKGKNPWEGGAVHRLDTPTSGLVIFARNQAFYDYIQDIQKKDLFVKTYRAVTERAPRPFNEEISSYFRSFGPRGAMVKVCISPDKADSGKLYTTKVKTVEINAENSVFECKITQGFRHQIRVHLAYAGCPIKGDSLYNPSYSGENLCLECTAVSFPLPNSEIFNYTAR